MTPRRTGIGKIAYYVGDQRPHKPTLTISLTPAVAAAWDDVDVHPASKALDAFGNPRLREVRQACSHVAGVLARLAWLIPADTQREGHRDEDCPPPPPFLDISCDVFRHSVRLDSWSPELLIVIAPRDRKAWEIWINQRLAELAQSDWICEHGVVADGAHPLSALTCGECKPLDDQKRIDDGAQPREQQSASSHLRAVP